MGGFLVIALAIPEAFEGERACVRPRLARRRRPARGHVREGNVARRRSPRSSGSSRSTSPPRARARRRRARRRRAVDPVDARRAPALGHAVARGRRGLRRRRPSTSSSGTGSSSSSRSASRSSSSAPAAPGSSSTPASCSSRCSRSRSAPSLWWAVLLATRARSSRRCSTHRRAGGRSSRSSAFGYWHFGLLLGDRRGRRGPEEGGRRPVRPARRAGSRRELAVGVALFLACDVGFRRTLGIPRAAPGSPRQRSRSRRSRSAPSSTAKAQIGALAAIVVGALARRGAVERGRPVSPAPQLPRRR